VESFGKCCGGVRKYNGCLLVQCDRISCWLVAMFEQFGEGVDEIVCDMFGAGALK